MEQVIPVIEDRFPLPVIYHRVLRTAGVGESYLAEKIAAWEDALPPSICLAYLPSLAQVKAPIDRDRGQRYLTCNIR